MYHFIKIFHKREVDQMCGPHEKTQLAVVWTQGDREVADKMVFKYIKTAKTNGWWRHITLIVWGPSVRLLANDAGLQEKAGELLALGVDMKANADTADEYGAAGNLQTLGIDVKDLGLGLTEVLQDENEDWAVLTV
jgi:hypothetical protein